MTRSKNTNKAVDNPEFLREIIQNQLQEYLEQKIAQHISTLEHSPMKGLKAFVVIAMAINPGS